MKTEVESSKSQSGQIKYVASVTMGTVMWRFNSGDSSIEYKSLFPNARFDLKRDTEEAYL